MLILVLLAVASAHTYTGDHPITYSWSGSVNQSHIEQSYKTDVPICLADVQLGEQTQDDYQDVLVRCINYRLKQRGLPSVRASYAAPQ